MPSSSVFRPILWPVLAPSLLFATGIGSVIPVLAIAALQIGASQSFAAIIVGLMGAVSLCCTVPAGFLIERLGDARAMVLATSCAVVVYGAAITSLAWRSSYSLVLYAGSLMALAPLMDIWNLARQAVVAEAMPTEHVGKAMTALGGTMRAGTLLGPVVGAGLQLAFPIWSVFVFAACTAIAAVGIMFLPSARAFDAEVSQKVRARQDVEVPTADRGEQNADGPSNSKKRRLDVRWDAVILAGISIATLAVARAVQPVVVQLWGVHIGLHGSEVSLLIAAGAALELLVMFPGAYVKDRLGRVPSLFICLAVFSVGFALMVLVPTIAGLVVAVAVMAVGNGMGAGVNMTIGADLSPPVGRAQVLGMWAIFTNVGRLGGPSLVSLVIVLSSLGAAIASASVLVAAGGVWILVWRSRINLPGTQATSRARPPAVE